MSTTIKKRHYYCSRPKLHWTLITDLLYPDDYGNSVSGEESADGGVKVWARGGCYGRNTQPTFADLESWLLDRFESVVLTGHSVNLSYSEPVTIYPQRH